MHPALPEALLDYLDSNARQDATQLALSRKDILGFPPSFVAHQLMGRQRAAEKLPSWLKHRGVVYPPKANLEQSSSERTALLKCKLLHASSPTPPSTLVDLSGGFGVDSFYFSKHFEKVLHVEPYGELNDIARHNHQLMGSENVEYYQATAENFLAAYSEKVNWIYLDPSRKAGGKKVFRLPDCEPDVTRLLPEIWAKTDNILIKTAPLLDISEALKQLPNTHQVVVVAIDNECREVLYFLKKDFSGEPQILCINHSKTVEEFQFLFSEEQDTSVSFQTPQTYLYEPNASILKAGAFKCVAQRHGLKKLAPSTHLYTANLYVEHFPGRIFKNLGELTLNKALLPHSKANVICRNHPLTPEGLKKKYKLQDGGEMYVIGCSGLHEKWMLVAERLR